MNLPPLPSVYRNPDIQRRLRAMRRRLRRQDIPVYPIGCAYIPGQHRTSPDQAWLRAIL